MFHSLPERKVLGLSIAQAFIEAPQNHPQGNALFQGFRDNGLASAAGGLRAIRSEKCVRL